MSFAANYLLIGQVCNNSVPLLIFQSMIPICRISASSLLLLIQILGLCPPAPGLTLSSANLHDFVINTWTGFQVRIINNYKSTARKKSEKSLKVWIFNKRVLPGRLLARTVSHCLMPMCVRVFHACAVKLGHSPRVSRANILQTGFPVDLFF